MGDPVLVLVGLVASLILAISAMRARGRPFAANVRMALIWAAIIVAVSLAIRWLGAA